MFDGDSSEVRRSPTQGPPHLDKESDVHCQFVEIHVVDVDIVDVIVKVEEIPRARKLLVLAAVELGRSLLELVDERCGVVDYASKVTDDGLGPLEGALLGSAFNL